MEQSTDPLPDPESDEELPGVIVELATLPPGSIITEQGIARLFQRCVTSVKRAVDRGELPPPCRLFGGNVWTASAVAAHIQARLEQAARERARAEEQLSRMRP